MSTLDQPVALLPLGSTRPSAWIERADAVAQRALAGMALLALLPAMLLIAMSILLTSRGGVFFRQERVGLNGARFVMWKFRTMCCGAEAMRDSLAHLNDHDGILFKIRRDPRITKVGRWLRRFSLDELPQLWNIVRGDMALVGPRPATPDEVERYDSLTQRRLWVKPGLTGLWQIDGRSDLPWNEALRLDLEYVAYRTPALDLGIIAKTFAAVVGGRGAY